jgi:transposase
MEGLTPICRRVAGIDVHRMLHVVTAVLEHEDGNIESLGREYGGFKRDCRALAAWLVELNVELVVMESTGVSIGKACTPIWNGPGSRSGS